MQKCLHPFWKTNVRDRLVTLADAFLSADSPPTSLNGSLRHRSIVGIEAHSIFFKKCFHPLWKTIVRDHDSQWILKAQEHHGDRSPPHHFLIFQPDHTNRCDRRKRRPLVVPDKHSQKLFSPAGENERTPSSCYSRRCTSAGVRLETSESLRRV